MKSKVLSLFLFLILCPLILFAGPMESSVRIRVNNANTGTGTAYDHDQSGTYIMTCAHLFSHNSPENSSVKVESFRASKVINSWSAQILAIDFRYDCAIIRIDGTLPVIPLASRTAHVGEYLTTVGCTRGAPPSYWKGHRVLSGNYSDLWVSIPPIPGRSGGGLFRNDKELVGVCNVTNGYSKGGYCNLTPLIKLNSWVVRKPKIEDRKLPTPRTPQPRQWVPGIRNNF